VKNGLERVNKVMMLALFALITVLAIHSLTLSGASEGLKFYLKPNFKTAKNIGIFNVMLAAMNQSFFTLSLGIASMEIFGSYMSKDRTLMSESLSIAGLDTFVAILSGLIIFPACFSYQVAPDRGPALIFMTLPKVFAHMPFGKVWGTLFFVFMTFASFSTVTAVFENLVAGCIDNFGWSRSKSVVFNCIFMLIASMPCVLGYNLWSGVHIIGARDILDSEDFIVSNLLLPIGALVYLMFCVTKMGWGFKNYQAECNTGEGVRLPAGLRPYLMFVLPVLILVILIGGLI
jgi:NSS family neurotransmitter:Na+ symporter